VTQEISELFKTALCNQTWAKTTQYDTAHGHRE
jgi:hypothetical protein